MAHNMPHVYDRSTAKCIPSLNRKPSIFIMNIHAQWQYMEIIDRTER